MNTRAFLHLSASLAAAMPLKQGATWTWVVRNRATNDSTFRTATVFGSVQRDSGTAWYLQARDSTTKQVDTALMLQRPNGTQNWLRGSTLLPWEPQPWNGVTGSRQGCPNCGAYPYTADTVGLPWGQVEVISTSAPVAPSSVAWSIAPTSANYPFPVVSSGLSSWDLAPGIWVDTIGMTRTRVLNASRMSQEDWMLVAFDTKPFPVTPDQLTLPDSGDSFVWDESSQSTATSQNYPYGPISDIQRKWEVLARPADSAGWNNVWIRETRSSIGSPDTTTTFNLQLNPTTGARHPERTAGCPEPDYAWWAEWVDSAFPQGKIRHEFENIWGYLTIGSTTEGTQWVERILANGIEDSLQCDINASTTIAQTGRVGEGTNTTRVLLSVNGVQVRQPDALVPQAARARPRETLATLAARYPSAIIHWHDIQGRSGQFSANQFSRNGPATGLLFLEATFPDGTNWSGSYLEGMR